MRRQAVTRRKSPEQSEEVADLSVKVQPRASRNELISGKGGIKVRLTSPPVDGAANEALVSFLAEHLGTSKSRIRIVSGHAAREKRIRINGMSLSDVRRLLNIQNE